jgi:hypothetical protein
MCRIFISAYVMHDKIQQDCKAAAIRRSLLTVSILSGRPKESEK